MKNNEEKLEGKRTGVITSIMVIILLTLMTIVQGINVPAIGMEGNKKFLDDKFTIPEQSPSNDCHNSSFHAKTMQNNSWIAIKFSSLKTISIGEISVSTYIKGENMKSEVETVILTNLVNKTYEIGSGSFGLCWLYDFFIHFEIGLINFTYDHLYRDEGWNENTRSTNNITLPPDTWYLISWIACTKETIISECSIDIWINTTDNDTQFLGTTQGNNSFLYTSMDFFGNLNIWSLGGSMVINGKKSFNINNILIGRFWSIYGDGIEKLGYTTPNGESKECIRIQKSRPGKREPWVYMSGNFDPYQPIIGEKGLWEFRIGMIANNMDLSFTYADIKLP